MSQRASKRGSEIVYKLMSKCVSEWESERASVWESEIVYKWTSKCVCEYVQCLSKTESGCVREPVSEEVS